MIINVLEILSVLLLISIVPTIWLVYKGRIKFLNGVFLGTFLFLVSFGISVFTIKLAYNINPIDYTIKTVTESFIDAVKQLPDVTDTQISEINRLVSELKNLYSVIMPTIIVTMFLFWSYMCHIVGKGIFAIFRKDVSNFPKFCDFKMKKSAVLLASVAYIISIFTNGSYAGYALANFSMIIFIVTCFCGLSMVDFWLRKKIRFSILRFFLYILIFTLTGIGLGIIFIVGMADAIFDFRNPKIVNGDKK